ncbi:MAG: hypothetical protein VXX85_04510 [Candidatus Margulisiibacteriota bacterium]|nr:hypothetical protein [Candidatus Margulisiibacteriota bacterium]
MKQLLFFLICISHLCIPQTLNIVENEFIKIITGPEGFDHPRFSIETTGGDPSTEKDNDLPLIYGRPKPWTSYTTIAVDNAIYGFGTQTLKRAGKNAIYGQVIDSVVTQNYMQASVKVGDVLATQTLQLFRNPLTNVKDAVLIEYQLKNESLTTKNIGLRIMMDTMMGTNDAAPFRIGEESIVSERVYKGDQISDFWQSFDSLSSPNIIAQGLLRYAPAALTPPDELILMNWGALADQPYAVKVEEGRSFIRDGEDEPDTALALLFNQNPLGPSQIRTYKTVMGLGGISLEPGDLALGLTSPKTLAITDPNKYTIIAYVSNTGGFSASNSIASLDLPKGLTLIKGKTSVDVGNILPGGSRQLMYVIKVDPKRAIEGDFDISLTVSSETLADQVIKRPIQFTGQPKLLIRPIGQPLIERGLDYFVDAPVEVINESDVSISNINVSLEVLSPFEKPSFETLERTILRLEPNQTKQLDWKLKVTNWFQGNHALPVNMISDYTKPVTSNVYVNVKLGDPKAKLYYSDPAFFVGDYGYVWITMMDMPTFSGLNLTIKWDDTYLKPIRVSPEPWLIEQREDALDSFVITNNAMEMIDLSAESPPWRMIIGKWHFKAIRDGDATVSIYQEDELLDTINILLRPTGDILENLEKEKSFDL